jgi:hypothetical protein
MIDGLKPYPSMKESGVSWLGAVPEHWTVAALRHRYAQCLGKMLDSKRIRGEHSVPYLRNIDVQWDRTATQGAEADVEVIEARRNKLKRGRFPTKEARDLGYRLACRALTIAGPEPAAGSVPDAIAGPFLKTVWRELRDLIEKPALHQSVKVFLEMLLFASAFGMAEPRQQSEVV